MGVNVGTHLCIRRPDREIEYLCSGPWIPRDYTLYGLMAGVRGEAEFFEPRGVPEDANRRLKWEMRDAPHAVDEYAQSWLTTAELRQVEQAYVHVMHSERADDPYRPSFGPEYGAGPYFAATIGAMRAIDDWCKENGGGQAILAFSFS